MDVAIAAGVAAAVIAATAMLGAVALATARAQRVAEQDAMFQAAALAGEGRRPDAAASRAERHREQAEKSKLGARLAKADVDATPGQWRLGTLAAAALAAAAAFALFHSFVLVALAAVVVLLGSSMYLRSRAAKVSDRFSEELAAALPQVAENMRTGMTAERAIDAVGRHTSDPLRGELARVCREMRFGSPLSESLAAMASRTESGDVRLIAVAVELQRETGGNLAEVFETVAEKIQTRMALRRHVKSITASARMQRTVLCLLPWVAMGLTFFNSEDAGDFWRSTAGIVVIAVVVVLELVGSAIMSRLCQIKVE